MLTLVRRARRRLLYNALLSEGANAVSAALLAFILLLLAGTEILNWQWTVSIPVAAALTGLYRVKQRFPSYYAVAQAVDKRLGLADTISTAYFFSHHDSAALPEVKTLQAERAEQTARSADPRRAIPLVFPRAGYAMAALFLVATSLFALRYGLTRRLDLRQPLAQMIQQNFIGKEPEKQASNSRRPPQPDPITQQDDNEAAARDDGQKTGDQQDMDAASDESSDPQSGKADAKAPSQDGKKQAGEGERSEGDKDSPADDRADNSDSENSGNQQQGNNKSDQKQDSGSKQDANSSSENSSIMSKFKDAVQNLLSRMKPQQGQSGQQQQSAMDQKNAANKGQQTGSKQQQSKDGQPQNGQQGDAQEGQSGEQAQNAQEQQSKGTGKSDSQQASKQPGTGVGSQDGDKNIKQAEQLAAMGKLSEIYGKRSATITGESTVEVQNTSQQLHTPYALRTGQHTQGGAEISRDEIPVALQSYVEQYFEQVRKQPAKKK